jgi:hypothetical protein
MIQNRVLNAPDDVVASFAQKYTDSAHIPGSMMTDPKTGMTKLTLDNGKVIPMNKAQLATYVTGLWKIDQGDPTGSADLASVDKTLQDLGDKRFGQMGTMAKANNDATYNAGQLANGRITAGAAATTARAHAGYYGAMTEKMGEETRMRTDASAAIKPFVDRYNALTPSDQAGPIGQGLQRSAALAASQSSKDVNGTLSAMRPTGRGNSDAKFQVENLWAAEEGKLVGANTPQADIQAQKDGFYARRGFAPDAAVQALTLGRDPKTNDPLTEADVRDFQMHFPNTPVDMGSLAWLKPKTQGLTGPSGSAFSPTKAEGKQRQDALLRSLSGIGMDGAFNGLTR